jgi:acetyl-CoA carboxylase carboxyl transferase subunit beta
MHEGVLSLMQMAKTSGALARHSQACLPYISVLTHPTTGGVTASFATLGDIIIAEPKCMIGFAGPRVVKETTHADLPPGFQTAEFMLQHGLVDQIVARKDMRPTLGKLLRYTTNAPV